MDDEDDESNDETGGVAPDLLKSYLAFLKRAVMARRLVSILVFVVGATLAIVVAAVWPRTYYSETKLFAQRTQAFHDENGTVAMWGAGDLILRQENLDSIIQKTDLVRLWYERRAPLLRLKDAISDKLRGKPDPKATAEMLRWELQKSLQVDTQDTSLTLGINWPDAPTTAVILEAAQQNFLEARHHQEISQLADYIAILERHAAALRTDLTTQAKQMNDFANAQIDAAKKKIESQTQQEAAARPAPAVVAPRAKAPSHTAENNDELTLLKQQLDQKKKDLQNLQDIRRNKVQELRAKLAELETTYTDAHPLVLETRANIEKFSKESQEEIAMRADVTELDAQIKATTSAALSAAAAGGSGYAPQGGGGNENSSAAPPLPTEIMGLLQQRQDTGDPALRAQFLYSVGKYTELRNQIGSARIQLDTAQAAFNDRYKIVAPPEVPSKPTKPKVPVLLGAGLALSLLLAIALPLIAELRTGKIVEQWQVTSLALPILGELRFPPGSSDSGAE